MNFVAEALRKKSQFSINVLFFFYLPEFGSRVHELFLVLLELLFLHVLVLLFDVPLIFLFLVQNRRVDLFPHF